METAAWVVRTDLSEIDCGLGRDKLLTLAGDFLIQLRTADLDPVEARLDDNAIDVLHAAIEVIAASAVIGWRIALADFASLYRFSSSAPWPEPDTGERQELLDACCTSAWRLARRKGDAREGEVWGSRLETTGQRPTEPVGESTTDPEGAEVLVSRCRKLRAKIDTSPAGARDEAEFLFSFLSEPKRPIGLFDEREYFLGETALIAGTACRILARRDESRRWFDRAEASFRLTVNAVADWSRVSYQRLAMLLEERRFDELLEHLPILIDSFERLDMFEDALKCRFLEGLALVETGDLAGSAAAFERLRAEADAAHNDGLLASALANLVHVHGMLGNTEEALTRSREVLPIFSRLGNRIHVGKVQWGIGSLLRAKGQFEAAIEAFGSARADFSELGMMADVAATRLMIADLYLELGEESAATREVLIALPVVEEYKLVPEGMAALSLLRESVRQQKVNHQALRDLHGFFEERVS